MKLTDILKSEHVLLPLRAATVKEATEQLADRLVAAGAVAEPQRLLAVIKHAWPEDMVSVGEHAFLPHFRTEAVRGLIAAVGVAPTPIRWEKDPHRTARIVVLIVAPPKETPTYLQVVGAFARTLSSPDNVLALLAAKSAEQVVQLPALAAIELPSHLTVRDVMTTQVRTIRPEETLGEAVSDVRASDRLTDSRVCLVAPETGLDRQLEKLLAGAGRLKVTAKPILEINPRHAIVVALASLGEDDLAFKQDAAHLLFDEARVLEGERPADARMFSDRLGRLLTRSLGKQSA